MKGRIVIAALTVIFNTTNAGADTADQWALQYLKAEAVWNLNKGSGVTVAVVDSGVTPSDNLGSRLLKGADFSAPADDIPGSTTVDEGLDGHGTGIAEIIAGADGNSRSTRGLAPSVSILPVRAFSGSPSGLTHGLSPSIDYAVTHGAQVINLSLTQPASEKKVARSIATALSHDVVVVAAVGNGGDSHQYYPAAYPGVLGVGAIDRLGKVWVQSNTGADVGLVAPGVDIYRDDNQGRQGYSDGTSEATAYVSAAAALMRSAHPTWTAPQVVAALIATADKPAAMHGAVRTDQYGYGILNVLAALKLTAPPPVGAVTSPEPVNSATKVEAAPQGSSDEGSGLAFGLVGGLVAVLVALVGTLVARRRGAGRRHG